MRVVLSNSSYKWGGVHLVTEMLAAGLTARGHDVLLLCRPGSELLERMRGRVPLAAILRGPDLGPAVILRCMRVIRRHASDVVLALMDKDLRLSGVAARALRRSVVVRRANDQPLHSAFARFFYRSVATHIVVNSEATKATLLDSAPQLVKQPVHVIYNGVRIADYEQAVPAELGIPREAVVFGFIGRFEARKGLYELMEAWPRVAARTPAAHLVLVGKGELELAARKRLSQDARVHFLGYRTDVPQLLRAMDVIVMPSHWEGFGLVAAEAMAAAKPVIASQTSSLTELIRDHVNGRTVPPRNAAVLAEAMVELAADADLRYRLGQQGLSIARNEFSEDRMLDQWEDLLRRAAHPA